MCLLRIIYNKCLSISEHLCVSAFILYGKIHHIFDITSRWIYFRIPNMKWLVETTISFYTSGRCWIFGMRCEPVDDNWESISSMDWLDTECISSNTTYNFNIFQPFQRMLGINKYSGLSSDNEDFVFMEIFSKPYIIPNTTSISEFIQNMNIWNFDNVRKYSSSYRSNTDVINIDMLYELFDSCKKEYSCSALDRELMYISSTKDAQYIRISVDNKISSKLNIIQTRSYTKFLSVRYVHPNMSIPIFIDLPKKLFIINNEILSATFILRWLEYNIGNGNYIFDKNYIIDIIDSSIKIVKFGYGDYCKLTEFGYTIIRSVNSITR
jgi:hypothetical protein